MRKMPGFVSDFRGRPVRLRERPRERKAGEDPRRGERGAPYGGDAPERGGESSPYVQPILETAAGRAQFLESVITRDLLMREALRRGIDRRPGVAERIAMARKSIVLEALLREVADKAPGLSDAALRKAYDANPEAYRVGERVKVSHMLFRDKARAMEMLARVNAGESFEALMKEVGTGDGEVAADLGEIERGNFVKEFEAAAFAAVPEWVRVRQDHLRIPPDQGVREIARGHPFVRRGEAEAPGRAARAGAAGGLRGDDRGVEETGDGPCPRQAGGPPGLPGRAGAGDGAGRAEGGIPAPPSQGK